MKALINPKSWMVVFVADVVWNTMNGTRLLPAQSPSPHHVGEDGDCGCLRYHFDACGTNSGATISVCIELGAPLVL